MGTTLACFIVYFDTFDLTELHVDQHCIRSPSVGLLFVFQQCDPEKLITESKFLKLESLQELMKVIVVQLILLTVLA